MKYTIHITLLTFLVLSCNKEKSTSVSKEVVKVTTEVITETKGYKLMEAKCFICHFPTPNSAKKEQMIAPPMLRVQEHYKPMYPKKEDFVNAIKTWVANPTEDKVLMPGTVRKWGIMPKLSYVDEDVRLIAETIYDINFGDSPKMHEKNQKLQLNNGKKWQLDEKSIMKVNTIIKKLKSFQSDNVKGYHNFGKEIFDTAKSVLLNKSVSKDKLVQLQAFFHNTEENMHEMMQIKTITEGEEQQVILKKKFNEFLNFFE